MSAPTCTASRDAPRTPGKPRSLRVGVLGVARVLATSWPALHAAGHRVTLIGCRDTARGSAVARDMIDKITTAAAAAKASMQPAPVMPRLCSYEGVVQSTDVDVVYITLPVSLRSPWVRACAEAGKHVVGEKPAAADAQELLAWLEAFSVRRLLFMDATRFTHGNRVRRVCEQVATLGGARHVEAHFSFHASNTFLDTDIRCDTRLEPHGALGDLGWDALRWILHLFDFATPTRVVGSVTATTSAGAIAAFTGHMTFSPGQASASSSGGSGGGGAAPATASFSCSFLSAYQQTVRVYTPSGVLEVRDACTPTGAEHPSFIVRRVERGAGADGRAAVMHTEVFPSPPTEVDGMQQTVELWRAVGASLVQLGSQEPLVVAPGESGGAAWGRRAYVTQLVMDKLLASAMVRSDAPVAESTPGPVRTDASAPVTAS